MGCAAGAGDDDVETVLARGPDIVGQGTGVPMGAEDTFFIGDTKLFEGGAGRGHDVPVAGAAHDDGYLAHKILNELQIYEDYPRVATPFRHFVEKNFHRRFVEIFRRKNLQNCPKKQ